MKKKYLPLYFILLFFTALIGGQSLFDTLDISAGPSKEEKKINNHYESIFSKMALLSSEKKLYKLSQVKAPIVILNFWASWCKPCLEEFPSIVKMKKKYSDKNIMVFGISSDDEDQKKNLDKIVKKYNLNFPNVIESTEKILEKFMIKAIPVSIIFHKGKVVEISNGAKDFSSGEAYEHFDQLLKK